MSVAPIWVPIALIALMLALLVWGVIGEIIHFWRRRGKTDRTR